MALLNGGEFIVPSSCSESKKPDWGRWFLVAIWTTAILLSIFGWLNQLAVGPTFFGVGALVLTAGLGGFFRFHKKPNIMWANPNFCYNWIGGLVGS